MEALLGGCCGLGFLGMFTALGTVFVIDGLWSRFTFVTGECQSCGYNVSGILRSRRCPECGAGFSEGSTIRTVYRRNYIEIAVGTVILGAVTIVVVTALRHR